MRDPVQAVHRENVYGRSLNACAVEVKHWRSAAGEVAREWGGSRDVVETVRLGVSELISNVARHVQNPRCYLRMMRIGTEVTVQVFDRCHRLPVVGNAPDWAAESGRGLWMLREMADGFGCERTLRCAGKIVWFRCVLPGGGR
ncbi:ATP-binding protein [Streptomyces harbinensis]|uniref:Serine/threonine-protein kinase RsbW n=1 Tax=Streptomyces harbinensis TaxID=1176198 RepID=A0A1I6TZL9_9ACTN|nr:ATP-binding protein [Streptomyces harbinensis]SFS94653.1 serine/threonine-protein kinase RsbW [Streptomyces harbinensis]